MKMIRFKSDRRGRLLAQYLMNPPPISMGRWVRMNVDEAKVLVASGAAEDVTRQDWADTGTPSLRIKRKEHHANHLSFSG